MKITIVDDDPEIMEVMFLALDHAGHSVTTSPSAPDVLPKLKSNPPNVLITDLMMAELDGLELCAQVRASTRLADTQIILISARTDPLWKQKARDAGAVGFIEKPIDPISFAADVENIAAKAAA